GPRSATRAESVVDERGHVQRPRHWRVILKRCREEHPLASAILAVVVVVVLARVVAVLGERGAVVVLARRQGIREVERGWRGRARRQAHTAVAPAHDVDDALAALTQPARAPGAV